MIKIENTEVVGWEAAIRGMRNPMNSWEKSDSGPCGGIGHIGCLNCYDRNNCDKRYDYEYHIGPNDRDLMMRLAKGGSVHAKYRRMIAVYVDITAPLYWWKEFDTYKVGTVANSCSTMHKIHEKEFDRGDFSYEHIPLGSDAYSDTWDFKTSDMFFPINVEDEIYWSSEDVLDITIQALNHYRNKYLEAKDKKYWWQMIQLIPSSYNQRRTVMLNYEVLAGIYPMRKDHKLDEWRELCQWIEQLPYSEIITCGSEKKLYKVGQYAEGYTEGTIELTEREAEIVERVINVKNWTVTHREDHSGIFSIEPCESEG